MAKKNILEMLKIKKKVVKKEDKKLPSDYNPDLPMSKQRHLRGVM